MILLLKRLSGQVLFLFSCFSLFLNDSVAAVQPITSPPPLSTAPVSSGGVWQVFLGLAVVLAVIAGAAWLIKRFVPGQVGAGGVLKLVGGVMVGPKERLVLVEVGETWLLLGVTAGQVNALHTMPKPQHIETEAEPFNDHAFPVWLKRAMQRNKRDPIS